MTVSISKEPHIINKLINILITVQNAERSITKKKQKSRQPKTQNSLTLKKKKTAKKEKTKNKKKAYLCSKSEKTIKPCQKKKNYLS